MTHPAFVAQLDAYLDGELALPEAGELEAHLRVCPDCARVEQRRRRLGAALREQLPRYQVPDTLRARVRTGLRAESSLEIKINGAVDVLFSDSLPELREQEVRHFLPKINPNGLILMHDASSHLKTVREAALRLEQEGLISVVLLPTPRGLVIAQKKEGRK